MHRCIANGCKQAVPELLPMCGRHWRLVPLELRRQTWAAWQVARDPILQATAAVDEAERKLVHRGQLKLL